MFYLFELSIGIDGQATIEQRISAPNQGTQCSFRDGQWNSGSFAAFRMETKNGDLKNGPTRPGTFGQANAKACTATK
jgi:hypothetical protein